MSKSVLKQIAKATVVATMLFGAALTAQAQPMMDRGGHGPAMMFGGEPRMMGHMLDSVDATDAQRAQIKQMVQAAMQDMKAQREAGRQFHQQGLTLFAAPVVDANAVEALRQQMSVQHEQISKRMSQLMVEVSRVLTPEQRAKLVERMQKRQARAAQHRREGSAPSRGN